MLSEKTIGLDQSKKKMTKEDILKDSPIIPGSWNPHNSNSKELQMAFYSVSCCWWTSFSEDLGSLPPVKYDSLNQELKEDEHGHSLPCCPHCGSLLYEAPLAEFIKTAENNPTRYGQGGIETFLKAHHRNSETCSRRWEDYK